MKIISVIGCGTMGNGIAQTFALFDFNVKLYDISLNNLDNAKKTILKNLERMVNKEVINHSDLQKTSNNITYTNDCLLYTSPSPRDRTRSRMPSSA